MSGSYELRKFKFARERRLVKGLRWIDRLKNEDLSHLPASSKTGKATAKKGTPLF
jgi:hypothetical protein